MEALQLIQERNVTNGIDEAEIPSTKVRVRPRLRNAEPIEVVTDEFERTGAEKSKESSTSLPVCIWSRVASSVCKLSPFHGLSLIRH